MIAIYHCNGGPTPATFDLLTSLINWTGNGTAPGRVVYSLAKTMNGAKVVQNRPVSPYPSTVVHTGDDVNVDTSYARADVSAGVSDLFQWVGLAHYKPDMQTSCTVSNNSPSCSTM